MDNIITAVVIIFIVALCVYRSRKMKKDGITDRKAKRKYRWTTFGWSVVLMFVFAGIINIVDPNYDKDSDSSSSTKTVKTHKATKTIKTHKVTKISKQKPSVQEKSSSLDKSSSKKKSRKTHELSKNEKVAAALMILRNNYKGQAEVWYNHENQFMIWPNKASFKKSLMYVINTNDTKDWKVLTDSIDELSKTLYSSNYGVKSPVCIVNPGNRDKILYSSLNGQATYDFMVR